MWARRSPTCPHPAWMPPRHLRGLLLQPPVPYPLGWEGQEVRKLGGQLVAAPLSLGSDSGVLDLGAHWNHLGALKYRHLDWTYSLILSPRGGLGHKVFKTPQVILMCCEGQELPPWPELSPPAGGGTSQGCRFSVWSPGKQSLPRAVALKGSPLHCLWLSALFPSGLCVSHV